MSIDSRKAIPVIGMVSSGKSTFLNSLLGTDVLEAKDDITTKFVCIIRHNQSLKEPIFYHLKLSKDQKSDDYNYSKDGEETIGANKIKEKIAKINANELSLESNSENLFYLLELNITNINNSEFLKRYDFYDMPGLNESLNEKNEKSSTKTKEENSINEKTAKKKKQMHSNIKEEELKYINKLFPYFKKKIDFGIIIVDTENYFYPTNINIINNIYNLFSKQIINYMIILNKIDKSDDPDETIRKCKAYFTNYIDSYKFRISDNFFYPLNSKQFKNEMLMKSNYENYYLYFLNEYCKNKDLTQKMQFSDFIYEKITEDKHSEDDKYNKISELADNIDDSKFEEIKEIYENNKNETNIDIKYGFDFEDDDSINILKALYQVFSDKSLIPPYSENVKDILAFFNNFNFETVKPEENENNQPTDDSFLKKLKKQETIIDKFIKVFHEFKKYTYKGSSDNIINSLEKDLEELRIMILNQRKIYIPLIGVTSSGKSTILNDIVGYKIFPESKEECTTRGIIIQHSFDGTSKLYEITIDSSLKNKNFFIFKEKKDINPIVGRDKIRSFLESVNEEYSYDEAKQFFILKTPIEFFNEYNINDDLKRRISFIDFPGSNSFKNVFNKKQGDLTGYEKLLRICTTFLFVNKGTALNLIENTEILNSTYYSIHKNSKIKDKNAFLKNCSFVMNMFSILKEEEKNIDKIRFGISDIIFGKKDYSNYVNASFFNAQQYSEFLKYKNYYNNINNVLLKLKEGYKKQFDVLYFSNLRKEKNFPNYCFKTLKKELENLSLKNDSNFKCGEEFNKLIESKIKGIMKELSLSSNANDSKTINKISNVLEFIQKNIRNISFFKNSNSEEFFNQLMIQIYNSDAYIEKEFNDYIITTMERFESFFRVPPNKRNTYAQNEFLKFFQEISFEFINMFEKCTFTEDFDSTKKDIDDYLKDKMTNAKQVLSENNNHIKASFNSIIQEIINKNLKELSTKIKNKFYNLHVSFTKLKHYANEKGKEINKKYNIDNSFIDDLEKIKLTNFVYRHFGIKDFLELNNQEFIENIIEVHGFFNVIKTFFHYLFKKDEKLRDNLLELKNKILDRFTTETINFNNNYENMQKAIIDELSRTMQTQSSDLSRINNEDFDKALQLFVEAKFILVVEESEDEGFVMEEEKKPNNQKNKDSDKHKNDKNDKKDSNIEKNKDLDQHKNDKKDSDSVIEKKEKVIVDNEPDDIFVVLLNKICSLFVEIICRLF